MNKKYLIAGVITAALCGTFIYCYAKNGSSNLDLETPNATPSNKMKAAAGKKEKVLVAYFTMPETDGTDGTDATSGASRVVVNGNLLGNTEYVAKVIQEATGGDLFALKTVQRYPGTHKDLVSYAKKEVASKARPKLVSKIENLDKYDVIFIGFPNWWYDMPMPIYTLFDEHDFSGKTIAPFCTHGGSRFSNALKTMADLEPKAVVTKGLAIARDNVAEAKPDVLKWLQEIGVKK